MNASLLHQARYPLKKERKNGRNVKERKISCRSLTLWSHLDSPRTPPKTLWQPPRTLWRPSRRIHPRPPDWAPKKRQSRQCNSWASRRTPGYAIFLDCSNTGTAASTGYGGIEWVDSNECSQGHPVQKERHRGTRAGDQAAGKFGREAGSTFKGGGLIWFHLYFCPILFLEARNPFSSDQLLFTVFSLLCIFSFAISTFYSAMVLWLLSRSYLQLLSVCLLYTYLPMLFVWMQSRKLTIRILILPSIKKYFLTERRLRRGSLL